MAVDTKVVIAGVVILAVLAIIVIIGAACCACILCAVVPNSSNWGGYTQTEHRTDTTVHAGAANIELWVDTPNGNVDVVESALTSDVTVTYDVFAPTGYLGDVRTGTDSEIVNNGTVRITAAATFNNNIIATGNRGANVRVTVPKNSSYTVSLNTQNGDVNLAPLIGRSAYLRTMNGNLNLNGGRYDGIYMETFNGNVNARNSYEATNVTLITRNGNVEADTLQTGGTLAASTWNGNILVTLPLNTSFTVDASTASGWVRHGSIRMAPTTENSKRLVGPTESGTGDLRLTLSTMSGNIDIDY